MASLAAGIATRLSPAGLFLGGLLCALTFTPSLLPRPWLAQGIIAGLTLALGYGSGIALARMWNYLQLPVVPRRWGGALIVTLAAVTVIRLVLYLRNVRDWQNETRQLMDMPQIEDVYYVSILVTAIATAAILLLVGWAVVTGIRWASRASLRLVDRRFAALLGVGMFLYALVGIVNGTLVSQAISMIDRAMAAADDSDPPGAHLPPMPERSGSLGSLVAWDQLGSMGKLFVTEGPDRARIEALTGRAAREPVRVYVGLRAARDTDGLARLALEELKRAGAFDRRLLVIATPTGTGWLDNAGIAPLEVLFGGDTAVVGVQYSYFTSALSLILEPGRAKDSATEVFNIIYGYWSSLPPGRRPDLYLFGLSLGSFASESAPSVYALLRNPIKGAVWAGPTFRNPLWRRVTAERDPSTRAWRPAFKGGTIVRVLSPGYRLDELGPDWEPVRLAYLANPSDAISFFEESMWFYSPAWLEEPRGPDVSPKLEWVPLVSFLQVAMDMLLAAGAPPGHGHSYALRDYLAAWAAVARPTGWSEADLAGLAKAME